MVVGDVHSSSSTGSERVQASSIRSYNPHTSNPSFPQQRQLASSATPALLSTPDNPISSTHHAPPYSTTNLRDSDTHIHEHGYTGSGNSAAATPPYPPHQQSPIINQERTFDGYDQSGFPLSSAPRGLASSPPSPQLLPTLRSSLSLAGSESTSPNRIKVRDLSHIQSFASEEVLTRSRNGSRRSLRGRQDGGQQYEISAMPVTDIIEMVAGLLTKITTTNDRQHEHIHRHIPPPEGTTGLSQQTTSVLAFHGKNVPSITILSYLSRIHKYCPTTYEVFLSLLVYFDRMTEMINSGTLSSFRYTDDATEARTPNRSDPSNFEGANPNIQRPSSSMSDPSSTSRSTHMLPTFISEADAYNLSHFFVVDSFNIHRLVIAGVTCASKFFSDVFYTNSRYAKVGGLPLVELNHLELQFLLLNDFRLSVPVEELEAYGSMLVEFYAKEVMAQQSGNHSTDALYMQTPIPTSP